MGNRRRHDFGDRPPGYYRPPESKRSRRFAEFFRRLGSEGIGVLTENTLAHVPDLAAPQVPRLIAAANLVAYGALGAGSEVAAQQAEHFLQSPEMAIAAGVVAAAGGGLVKSGARWVARRGRPPEEPVTDQLARLRSVMEDRLERQQSDMTDLKGQVARLQSLLAGQEEQRARQEELAQREAHVAREQEQVAQREAHLTRQEERLAQREAREALNARLQRLKEHQSRGRSRARVRDAGRRPGRER